MPKAITTLTIEHEVDNEGNLSPELAETIDEFLKQLEFRVKEYDQYFHVKYATNQE